MVCSMHQGLRGKKAWAWLLRDQRASDPLVDAQLDGGRDNHAARQNVSSAIERERKMELP